MGLSPDMKEELDQRFSWKLTNVPELENPVLAVFEYSPNASQRPISIALDFSGGAKCWLTESTVQEIDNEGPKPHAQYREFVLERRHFFPYSIQAPPQTIFEDIHVLASVCQRLYLHTIHGV